MRPPLILIAACVGLLAGCGGDDGSGGKGRRASVGAGEPVRVVAHEYSFDPSGVVVHGAGKLTLRLANHGSLAHNLRVLDGNRDVGGTPTFQGARTESGTVELRPGAYRLVCTVGDHEQLGMKGTLEIRAR